MKTNFLFLSSFLLCIQSYLFNHIDTTSTNVLSTEAAKSINNNTNNEFIQNVTSCSISRGTTQGLEPIVIGRCENFINVVKKTNSEIQSKNINCNLLWNEFKNAILSKDPCQITYESFQSFIKLGQHPISLDKYMFWSGTKDTSHLISKVLGYSTLEDTLIGYILDDLKFCSAHQSSFTTTYCPEDCVTRNNPFLIAASIDFARRASGRAVAILNASMARGGAISNQSTFMRFEVPNLVSGQLTELKVILTSTPGEEKFETCSQPRTLVYLEQQLKEKNIKYSCEEDTIEWLDTRLLLCFLYPHSERCKSLLETLNSPIFLKT